MAVEEHVLDLLPAYALDCLDETETIQVAEHLAGCAECRAELLAYQATADQLVLAAPMVDPPPALRSRLLERIQPSTTSLPQPQSSWWSSFSHIFRQTAPVWGGVGLLLILFLAASNFWLWQQVNQIRTDTTSPTLMRTVTLTGTAAAPEASGLVAISLDGEHGSLVVDRLPPLGESEQYQLWLIQDGHRDSGGVFSVGEEGYGSLWVSSPQPLGDYSALGITIEPAGGSPGPTGPKVMGGTLN